MGFVDGEAFDRGEAQVYWRWVPHANIMFTHPRREALDTIFRWLEPFGLVREADDLDPARDWAAPADCGPPAA